MGASHKKSASRFWPIKVISLKSLYFYLFMCKLGHEAFFFFLIFSSTVTVTIQISEFNELLQRFYCGKVTVLAK